MIGMKKDSISRGRQVLQGQLEVVAIVYRSHTPYLEEGRALFPTHHSRTEALVAILELQPVKVSFFQTTAAWGCLLGLVPGTALSIPLTDWGSLWIVC